MLLHYVPAITERIGRRERAVCGALVEGGQFSTEPTCDLCRDWLTRDAQDTADLLDYLRTPLSHPVKHVPFDPCGDYAERRR